ncbi:restriction endonuclease [Paenibacillus sp. WC2504]|uniref:restriction endonuclease n=1 Tax=Paenibacillus sp. WC2504 TaxID=3461403 RepID=UPI0040463426
MSAGKEFEQKVFSTIEALVKNEELGVSRTAKVYLNKGYFSRDRGKNIIADVSVEVFVANSETPSILWIWECKDYGKKIPVDDIEEFHSKLEQIGSDNTKGTLITSKGAFQKAALNYASSKKIGLARLMPNDQVSWVMYHMDPFTFDKFQATNTIKALTNKSHVAENSNFYGLTLSNNLSWSLEQYIQHEINEMLNEL